MPQSFKCSLLKQYQEKALGHGSTLHDTDLPLPSPEHRPSFLHQLDGNCSLSSSSHCSVSDNDGTIFSPQVNSTPNTVPNSEPEPSTDAPGLLDSLTIPTLSSVSLQSWSDLDNFLPFAVSPQSDAQYQNLTQEPDPNQTQH